MLILNSRYERILTRIKYQIGPIASCLAKNILEFLLCARRPPRVIEIKHAITIEPGDSFFDGSRITPRGLDELCGPILEVRNGYVSFVHFTVKE